LDSDWKIIAGQPRNKPAVQVTPDDLAYVIYTSGSTGQPKGVEITHQALVNFAASTCSTFQLKPTDRILQFTTLSFDTAAEEIFPTLISGATLVLRSDSMLDTPEHFIEQCGVQKISVLGLPTAYWHELAEKLSPESPLPMPLRLVVIGGEKIIPERLAQWRRIAAGRVRLLNRYGPTEATVSVTTQELDRSPENENGPSPMPLGRREVPIGRPISNVQLYILDAHLNPVPAGVCGELCIAGVALAKGYYKRPEVTPKKFVPNPFSKVPGDRLYKTGDQARYLSDGTIELAGRLDHQIKIRGFRVELEEIEAALHAHPMTRQAVVVALNGSNGDQRLVAYLTVVPGSTLAGDELRTFLKNRLPAYMVPSTFVFLDALPLTSNGKIDRHALPEPHEKESTQRTDFVAPRTDVERQLAADWEAVLGTAPIGVRADFFDLGGHSLVAVRLISRIDKRFGKRLPLAALFEAPTIEQLAVVLQQKDPHSQNSLPTDRGSIPRRGSHQPVPLSFAQRRLWFLYRLEPGRSVYNVPIALRIRGTLDPLALKQALDFVVLRHEALRTTIAVVDGQPQQIVQNPAPIQLPILDLLLEDNERREAEARRWCEEEARSPFDISVGPLMRARMLKLSSEDWVFLLTMHHIICDAWSVETLFRELETFYADFTSNRMPSLADLPIQYGDFAAWQCDQIHGAAMKSHLDFWEEHLRDVPPFLNLPADWPRPPVQTYRGATCSFPLPPALPDALLALCRQEQVTLFMAMLAAFTVLLHRYSDQDDIVVGSPVANRNAHELEPLIGFFVNTLALRTKVSSNPTFRQLLRQVRTAVLEADAHQDLPFEKLVEELRPQRDNSRSPLFQVMFALNGPAKDLTLPGLTISRFPIESDCAKFDLTLFIHEEPGQLRCSIEFNTDLFAPSTIQRMGRHYETILEAVTADPDRSAGLLPVLPPAERHEVLLQLNQTLSEYPHDASIHELFERQAARSPRALAAVSTNVSLTYDVLNRRANRMAHLLHVRGVQPGARVCVYLENPAEIVTAWLGVLKAGGAYVPLDTSYPVERLAFMIKDSSASAIITLGTLQSRLPQTGAIVLALDTDHDELAGMPEVDCAIRTDANSPAYVIYTSGSSGTPKGVVIPHRAVNRLVLNTNYIRVTTADVVAQISNCSFDAATFEVWGALLNGARLAVIPKEVLLSPGDFATQIREQGVTVMFLTTALFNEMARSVPTAFAKLRYLLFGGETVKPHWVAEVLKHGPPENLLHVYGPTESTTFATWHRVQSVPKDAATVPIGRPVANTTVYLFDRYLQPVPIGVPGEIYVGGDGLALEYLNQPALTEQKFVRSPLPEHSGTRLYRTGDLARLRPDGDIEFIRRMDHQGKIRGFLVEPEEIEAVLEQHPAVLKAAVLAGLDVTGNQCLTGYFAVRAGAVPSAADLRAFLKAKLPEYMVPSLFVMLSDIPLTSNGKVDRAALRSRDDSALAVEEYPVAPRDALESILVKLWESLLPAQPIGIQDNFFDLGGHSLLAAHLVSRIEKATGEHLALSIFFQGPTIEQLASVIRNRAGKPSSPSIAALHPFGFRPPLFWVYGDHSNVVLQRLLPADQPLYAFVHQCQDGKPAAYSTVEAIAAAYLRDVRAIQPKGPHYLGGFSFGGLVAYAMARQLAQEGECPALVALLDPTWQETGKPSEPADVSDIEQGEAARHQTIRAWSKRHLGQLDKLDPKAKLAYIWTRIDNLLNKHIEQCKKNIRRVQYRFYLAAGRPIPVHLRSTYLVDLYTKAARHYLPVTFSGRVVLFLGTDSRAKRRKYWRKLVGENLEIQELPGSHIELVRGIQVQEFAGKLKRCLEGVQHDIASRDDGHHLVTHASEKER
jgi:amino acid adenylation domain-containing protein